MSQPLCLDLFCCAGGAARGYQEAGFYVVGVDIEPQPNYVGDHFIQADALQPPVDLGDFDLIHASPPCQDNTPMNNRAKKNGWQVRWENLIPPTRALLREAGVPYVIENVIGADLIAPMMLTGEMFGLTTSRPRLFELGGWFAMSPPRMRRQEDALAVYGKPDGRRLWDRVDGSQLRAWSSLEEGREALGVPWMTDELEIREAIPPAFTKFIGEAFISQLEHADAR